MLHLIFLVVILSSCKGKDLPLVDLNQVDLIHRKVNSFEITKYNKDTCRLELKAAVTTDLFAIAQDKKVPLLHGAICLTPEDYTKYKTFLETECEQERK